MDYMYLVNTITSFDVLSKAVEELVKRSRHVNLITPDWRSVLENHKVYQKHVKGEVEYLNGRPVCNEKAYNKRIKDHNDMYEVVLVNEWSLSKDKTTNDYSLISRTSNTDTPLYQIAWSMRENDKYTLHDGGRFFICECNPQLCSDCRAVYLNYKMVPPRKNWCIKSLRVFDGEKILMTHTKNFIESFSNMNFLGILRLSIQSRTTFGSNCYKICGMVKELIIFQHSVLLPSTPLCLEPLMGFQCIEYPEEEEGETEEN